MKKGLSIIALASFIFLGNTTAQAQAGLKQSNKQYDRWAYIESATIYEKVLKRGFVSQDLLEKLGNAYYFNARYQEANKHYEQLFTEYANEEIATEYYYRYGQTLQHTGNETEAQRYYDLFVSKAGSHTQITQFRKDEAALKKQIQENSGRYDKVANLEINTPYADYGSYVHNNALYFTSARDTGNLSKKVHTWTNESFTSLYSYSLDKEPVKRNITRIKGDVKSKLNESTAVVTKDGQTMYFTRNNILNNKRGYDQDTKLKIYRVKRIICNILH